MKVARSFAEIPAYFNKTSVPPTIACVHDR